MKTKNNDIITQNKIFGWIALVTGLILLIPLIAMQFKDDVVWTLSDFIVMGTLLFGSGSLFVLVARKVNKKYRTAVGIAFFVALLLMWVHLAVGIVDTWPFAGS